MKLKKVWISNHLFFKGDIYGHECDRIILEVAWPIFKYLVDENHIEKYFFIRYSEFGTHIRMRFFGDSEKLDTIVKPFVEQQIKKLFPKELIAYPQIQNENLNNNKNYLWIDYEPEKERYGGDKAIRVAEDFFYYSSLASIKLLSEMTPGDKTARFGKALLSMLILGYVFAGTRDDTVTWFENYGKGYLRARINNPEDEAAWNEMFAKGFDKQSDKLQEYIEYAWSILDDDEELTESLDEYGKNLGKVKAELNGLLKTSDVIKTNKAIEGWSELRMSIISSYIHMMNNRLGVSIPEESYLAHLITNSLKIIKEADEPHK